MDGVVGVERCAPKAGAPREVVQRLVVWENSLDSCNCLKISAGASGIASDHAVTVWDSNQRQGSVLTN